MKQKKTIAVTQEDFHRLCWHTIKHLTSLEDRLPVVESYEMLRKYLPKLEPATLNHLQYILKERLNPIHSMDSLYRKEGLVFSSALDRAINIQDSCFKGSLNEEKK